MELKYYQLEPKAYLNLFRVYKAKVINLRAEIDRLEDPTTSVRMDGLPRSGGINHPTEDAALRLAEVKAKYKEAIKVSDEVCDDIMDTINTLEDPRSARLLNLRYCQGLAWYKIASQLYYSEAYVKKELHTKALEQVELEMKRKARRLTDESGL